MVLLNCRGFVVQLVVDMSKCCGLVLYVRFAADLLWTCCGFVADLLYNKLYNKCTTNRDNGVRPQQKIREISMSCGNVSGKKLDFFSFGYSNLYLYLLDACFFTLYKNTFVMFLLANDRREEKGPNQRVTLSRRCHRLLVLSFGSFLEKCSIFVLSGL